ncbi:KR domain-containing protein [Aspergillus insuetus]
MEIPEIFGGMLEMQAREDWFPLSAIQYAQGFDIIKVYEQEGVPQAASLQPLSQHEGDDSVGPLRLNPESTYMVTGGTRGIGLEIASWLAGHGARHLILVSRSGSSGDTARIAELEAQGVTVHMLAVDLSIPGLESVLRLEIGKLHLPDIKGVVHAAGIAGWHTIESCTPADIANVLAPKVRGTLTLAALFPPGTLDFFVLMSSVGQLVGFPGQMSYAPANAFLDGLATLRRRDGDNCTSIQWTSWSDVGMLAESKSVTRMVTRGMNDRGITFINVEEALEAWEHVINLKDQRSQGTRGKLRFKVLRGMHAYHCHMADSIVDACAELSASLPFQRPTHPFISCHENNPENIGSWTGPGSNIIARNTRGPVYFRRAMQRIVDHLGQSCTFLEAGIGGPIIAMAQNAVVKAEHTFIAIGATDLIRSLADATATLWKSSAEQFWPFHPSQREFFSTSQG